MVDIAEHIGIVVRQRNNGADADEGVVVGSRVELSKMEHIQWEQHFDGVDLAVATLST